MDESKSIERERYDGRSLSLLTLDPCSIKDHDLVPHLHAAPYLHYNTMIRREFRGGQMLLELCAGIGQHTRAALETGANVIATDISERSLEVLNLRFSQFENLSTEVADVENLPFGDETFDGVICAGGLSYGKPDLVDCELLRVLKPNGTIVMVDSLDENPIYRFNRRLHVLRGNRTSHTVSRIPSLSRISAMRQHFVDSELKFFGSALWFLSPLSSIVGEKCARLLSDWADANIQSPKSAFKFVLTARQRRAIA